MLEAGNVTENCMCGNCLRELRPPDVLYQMPCKIGQHEGITFLCDGCGDVYNTGFAAGEKFGKQSMRPGRGHDVSDLYEDNVASEQPENDVGETTERSKFRTVEEYIGGMGEAESEKTARADDLIKRAVEKTAGKMIFDAAVRLKVPESGVDAVDAMIRKSRRWDAAVAALQGILAGDMTSGQYGKLAHKCAGELLAEADKGVDDGEG